jgi:hypothetical protein
MAGEWLKFEANTPEKPEVLAITIAMGWDDPDLTVGKLMRVWRWFDQQTVNGNAPSVTAALLDRLIGVSGLCQAMANVGWLVIDDHGLTLPNFERHNGKTAKDRVLTAKRVAAHKSNAKGNADIVSDALPREEKRREEDKEAIASSSASAQPTCDDEPDDGVPPCPFDPLIDLYEAALPVLPTVRRSLFAKGANGKALRARWRWVMTAKHERGERKGERIAITVDEGKAWFARYFDYVAESDFLSGRSGKFQACDLGWLVTAANFEKVLSGKYHNEQREVAYA